jgi:hypothetical protein
MKRREQQQQQPMRTPLPHLPRARHLLQLGHDYAIMAAAVLVSQARPILTETAMPHSSRATHRVHPRRRLIERRRGRRRGFVGYTGRGCGCGCGCSSSLCTGDSDDASLTSPTNYGR